MSNENVPEVTDAQVVEVAPVVVSTEDSIKTQRTNFQAQLDQVRKDMTSLQQQFENKKTLALKLEGALEGLDILQKSLQK